MAIPKRADRAWMHTTTTGTGTITLDTAVSGYQTFAAAGIADGDTVRYTIVDGANWEIGTGVYETTGTTLTRSVDQSSNSDAAINLSGSATIFIDLPAKDVMTAAVVTLLIFDDETDVAVGDGAGDVFWRVPTVLDGWNLVEVAACVQTAGVTGSTVIQIHNITQAVDMLSTRLTINTGDLDSKDAASPAVIDTSNDDVAGGDQLRFDVDNISTGTAPKGLLIELTFHKP